MNDFYTPSEYAEILGVEPITVRRMLRRGELDGKKFGRGWRIPKSDGATLYTPEEFATKSGVLPSTVRKWLRCGKIQGTKIGRLWRIPERELKKVLPDEKE